MQRKSNKHAVGTADLRQHFSNYFEFLLGEQRHKLQQIIGTGACQFDLPALLVDIDCRINYLRGAVRMGKLLCLIDQDEAKANFEVLSAERERLRATAIGEPKSTQEGSTRPTTTARLDAIRRSLHTVTRV